MVYHWSMVCFLLWMNIYLNIISNSDIFLFSDYILKLMMFQCVFLYHFFHACYPIFSFYWSSTSDPSYPCTRQFFFTRVYKYLVNLIYIYIYIIFRLERSSQLQVLPSVNWVTWQCSYIRPVNLARPGTVNVVSYIYIVHVLVIIISNLPLSHQMPKIMSGTPTL